MFGMDGGDIYHSKEQLKHAVDRDEWTKAEFLDGLKRAGQGGGPALIKRTNRELLVDFASEEFGINRETFNELYPKHD